MSSRDGRRFTVVIPASEIKKIFSWVLKHPTEETGGDLFGSWDEEQDGLENKLNILHVVGPGKLCRRTTYSFHQDVRYSSRIATYLNEHHGMEHVAVWHSHQSGLDQPSAPDTNAIWGTMPSYAIKRFVVIIASIVDKSSEDDISPIALKCFLFEIDERTNKRFPVLLGKFRVLPEDSKTVCSCGDIKEAEGVEADAESLLTAEELQTFEIIETETSVIGYRKQNVTEA